jgi:hypothetical protein
MILNLTQHPATPAQIAAGVVDLPANEREVVSKLLTFDTLPKEGEVFDRAYALAAAASESLGRMGAEVFGQVMIGGASWLMSALETALRDNGIEPLYAFSIRESVEEVQANGTVRKVNTFQHAGFVPAWREADE